MTRGCLLRRGFTKPRSDATLKHCLCNRTHAANILGISIRTLRNKLNEYAGDGASIPPPANGMGDFARGAA